MLQCWAFTFACRQLLYGPPVKGRWGIWLDVPTDTIKTTLMTWYVALCDTVHAIDSMDRPVVRKEYQQLVFVCHFPLIWMARVWDFNIFVLFCKEYVEIGCQGVSK